MNTQFNTVLLKFEEKRTANEKFNIARWCIFKVGWCHATAVGILCVIMDYDIISGKISISAQFQKPMFLSKCDILQQNASKSSYPYLKMSSVLFHRWNAKEWNNRYLAWPGTSPWGCC